MWLQAFKQGQFLNSDIISYFLRQQVFLAQVEVAEQKELMLDLVRLLKVQIITNQQGESQLMEVFYDLGRFERDCGYRERAVYMYQAVIERGLAQVMGMDVREYEGFCDLEYPKIGEMKSFMGFIDYLKLKKNNAQEKILLAVPDDFIKEPPSAVQANWWPKKTYLDSEYISRNSESIVFYSDVKPLVELLSVDSFQQLLSVVAHFIQMLEINIPCGLCPQCCWKGEDVGLE